MNEFKECTAHKLRIFPHPMLLLIQAAKFFLYCMRHSQLLEIVYFASLIVCRAADEFLLKI